MEKGKLIVLCGTEGSGKTSTINRLKAEQGSEKFVFTREPGGSKTAEEIRQFIFSHPELDTKARFHLFWAARMDHWQALILPALESGKHVICDRFDCCTFAFQLYGEGHHHLYNLFRQIRDDMIPSWKKEWMPHYIHFDLPPFAGLGRKISDGDRNFFDDKALQFHERVREGYYAFAAYYPMERINADQSQNEVWLEFRSVLDNVLG